MRLRGEPALRKHLPEHDQKAAPSSEKRKEIGLELAKTRLRVGYESTTYCNQAKQPTNTSHE